MRLRALARDGVRCIVAAWWKKEQGRWNVGCSVGKRRGHLLWARQRARRGRERQVNNQQCTRDNAQKKEKKKRKKKATSHQPPATSHQPPATSHQQKPMLQQCTATPPAMVARGKRAARERSEGTCHQGCQTAQKEEVEGGRHTARGCGSRDELVGDAGVS